MEHPYKFDLSKRSNGENGGECVSFWPGSETLLQGWP